MVGQGEAAIVHAVGLPYRERSHFDAQQVLESGGTRPYELSTGWLGRALVASGSKGLALNTAVPLVLRGRAESTPGRRRRCRNRRPIWSPGSSACTPTTPRWRRRCARARQLRADTPAADAGRGAATMAGSGPRAGAFVRLVAPRGRVPGPARRAAGGGARARRLGHPCEPGQAERPARRRIAPARRSAWPRCATASSPAAPGSARSVVVVDRVRPRGRGQRHARHRPRHRRRRLRARRRGPGRAGRSPTGRASRRASATRAATCA